MKNSTFVSVALVSISTVLATPAFGQMDHGSHGGGHGGGKQASPAQSPTMEIVGKKEAKAGATRISFRLKRAGKELRARDLAVSHEKKLHVLIYDPSLTQFFHVHPEEKNGVWTTEDVPFAVNGEYRVWAEGKMNGEEATFTVSQPFKVTGGQPAIKRPATLPAVTESTVGTSKAVLTGADALVAGKEVMPILELSRTDGSKPVLKPYLGAMAHVVVVPLSGDKLIHVHPMDTDTPTKLMVHTTFPKPGDYRVWIQFDDGGELKTATMAVNVK
jgi:hypothetical protein